MKVVTAPKKGTGDAGTTFAVIELTGKTKISQVIAAVESAKTPHASKVAPDVTGLAPFKLKATTTVDEIRKALVKAGLLEE